MLYNNYDHCICLINLIYFFRLVLFNVIKNSILEKQMIHHIFFAIIITLNKLDIYIFKLIILLEFLPHKFIYILDISN